MYRNLALAATAACFMAMAGTPALAGGGSDTTGEGFHCYAFFTFDADPDKFVQAMINEESADVAGEKINEILIKYADEGATLDLLVGNVVGVCEGDAVTPPDKIVFVSETATTGDFSGIVIIGGIEIGEGLTSIAWADAICEAEASAAGLGGTWLAWLSGNGITPNNRFTRSTTPYISSFTGSRLIIAYEYVDLISRIPLNQISTFADGTFNSGIGSFVWTGTVGGGEQARADCEGWSSAAMAASAVGGQILFAQGTGQFWTNRTVLTCDNDHSFYCFEQ